MLSGTVWMRKNQEKWTAIIDAKQVSTPSVNLTCVAQCIKELNVSALISTVSTRRQSNHHQLPKKPPNGCLKRLSSAKADTPDRAVSLSFGIPSRSFDPWKFGFAHHQTALRVRAAHHDEVCCRAGFFVQVFIGDDQRRADPDGLRKAVGYLIGDGDAVEGCNRCIGVRCDGSGGPIRFAIPTRLRPDGSSDCDFPPSDTTVQRMSPPPLA